MDNLKTLMDKKEYELVIKLTNGNEEVTPLFYRITSFIALGQFQDALDCINTNLVILSERLELLIKIHIEVLCLMGKFDEARKELQYYENAPYESQVVEEVLRSMPKYINDEEKNYKTINKHVDIEEIYSMLESTDDDTVLFGLSSLNDYDISSFINLIKDILINYKNQLIRSYALLLLVKKEYSQPVSFNSEGKIIKVIPRDLNQPFDETFEEDLKKISICYKNTTEAEIMANIYSRLVLNCYPNKVAFHKEDLFEALNIIANKMIDPQFDQNIAISNDKILKIISYIEEIEKSF